MLTPVFHPNIAPHAVCIGDHWSAGEPLASIVARIGEMIAYQSYNTKSPLNGEAAHWVKDNFHRLPLDPVSLLVEEGPGPGPGGAGAGTFSRPLPPPPEEPRPAVTPAPPVPEATLTVTCPECGEVLRLPARAAGKRGRCPQCRSLFLVPSGG
jgi:hypothetical protein